MARFIQIVSWTAKGLAYIWMLLLAFGLFGKLYQFVEAEGVRQGVAAWLRWFDPRDPINMIVHVVELLPAGALLMLAAWLDARREAIVDRNQPKT